MEKSFKSHFFLVKELNKGNELAFKYLYSAYYNELCVFANGLIKDAALAEDLVQNVMLAIWKKKPNINIKTSVKSYLYKAVYNNFINHCRKKQKEFTMIQKMRADVLLSFSEENDDVVDEKIKLVRSEIDKLPTKCKEVFIMNKVNGMRYKEVAEELNISVKTVEAHISKALRQIKSRLHNKVKP